MDELISKKATIDAIGEVHPLDYNAQAIKSRIESLPSAHPETTRRIVGKSKGGMTLWYECERCGEPVDEGDKFCRGCGAKMEVNSESN